jgi:type II secretory pathway predicted ATPase ExeA
MSWIDDLALRFGRKRRLGPGPASSPLASESAASAQAAFFRPPPREPDNLDLPRFQSTAGDQLDPRLMDPFSAARLRLRDAFTPSQPIADRRMYAGRIDALTALIRSIEDQRLHAVVHGERGIGKTSTLNILSQAAQEARYLVIYISCGEGSSFDEVFRAACSQIPLLFHRDYGPTHASTESGGVFADLLTAAPVSTRRAGDILARVTGTRVLIILDEFDRAESYQFRSAIGELMKDLSDRSVRVQLVISGVAANLTELLEYIPSIQRNVFALELPKMTDAEIRQLVSKGETASGLAFPEDAVALLVMFANGFPYLASLLSHHAGLAAVDEGRTAVTRADVGFAADQALLELKSRISRRAQMQIADAVQQGALTLVGGMARAAQSATGRFSVKDIKLAPAELSEGPPLAARIEALVQQGVLVEGVDDEFGRRYRFLEESVPLYLALLSAKDREATKRAPVS